MLESRIAELKKNIRENNKNTTEGTKSTTETLVARLDQIEKRNIEKDKEASESKTSIEDFLNIMMVKQDERAA